MPFNSATIYIYVCVYNIHISTSGCFLCHLLNLNSSLSPPPIYIIITKNIRYLLWNRGAWHFFHDTYLTIEVQGIGALIIYMIPVPLLT